MKDTRRRFIVLFFVVALAHGAFLAAAAPLVRRGAETKAPGLVVSVTMPARPGPTALRASAEPRTAAALTSRVPPPKAAEITPRIKPPPPMVRPRPRTAPRVTRPRPVVKRTVRRPRRRVRARARPHRPAKTRPPRPWRMASRGQSRPVSSGPPAPTGQIRTAHLGATRQPGLLKPDVRAVCLNRHIFQRHYPEWARQRGWQGRVVLKVLVTRDGRVGRVQTVRRSGHGLLDRTAVRVARALRFKPARRNGRAVESWVRVPVKYVIVDPD